MQYFEIILENGHMGAGKGYEVTRYFKGKDAISVISKIRRLPRIKKRHTIEAVKFLRAITREEYIKGKIGEFKNTYLWRSWRGYRCPVCGRFFEDAVSLKQHMETYETLPNVACLNL